MPSSTGSVNEELAKSSLHNEEEEVTCTENISKDDITGTWTQSILSSLTFGKFPASLDVDVPSKLDEPLLNNTAENDEGDDDPHSKDIDVGRLCFPIITRFLMNFDTRHSRELEDDGNVQLWVNQNVFVMTLVGLSYGAMNSVWNTTIIGAYLNQKEEEEEEDDDDADTTFYGGYVVSVTSLIVTLASLPVARYLDSYQNPIEFMRISSKFIILLSLLSGLYLLTLDISSTELNDDDGGLTDDAANQTFFLFAAETICIFIVNVLVGGPALAIAMNSIPFGYHRWFGLVRFYIACVFLTWIGPIINLILHEYDGYQWTKAHVRNVMAIGIFFTVTTAFAMSKFKAEKVLRPLDDWSDSGVGGDGTSQHRTSTVPLTNGNDAEISIPGSQWGIYRIYERYIGWEPESRTVGPYLVLATAFTGFGTGLVEEYFTDFFINDTDLRYYQIQLVFVGLPLVIIVGFLSSCKFVFFVGRTPSIIMFKATAALISFVLSFSLVMIGKANEDNSVPGYLVKNFFAYGSIPLETSILIEFLQSDQVFLYLGLYANFQFSWSAAVTLGAVLKESTQFGSVLFFSAICMTIGALLYVPLIPIVGELDRTTLMNISHEREIQEDM